MLQPLESRPMTQGVFFDLIQSDPQLASSARSGLESLISILRERAIEVTTTLQACHRRAHRAQSRIRTSEGQHQVLVEAQALDSDEGMAMPLRTADQRRSIRAQASMLSMDAVITAMNTASNDLDDAIDEWAGTWRRATHLMWGLKSVCVRLAWRCLRARWALTFLRVAFSGSCDGSASGAVRKPTLPPCSYAYVCGFEGLFYAGSHRGVLGRGCRNGWGLRRRQMWCSHSQR